MRGNDWSAEHMSRKEEAWLAGVPRGEAEQGDRQSGGMYLVDLAGTSDQLCVLGMSCDHPHLWT